MIISASRRTDIPAFFSEWFINRIREGFCTVPNPFNPKQISTVKLDKENVDVIVFWTKYAAPMIKHLRELDQRNYKYYFHYTITDYPRELEHKSPSFSTVINSFKRLSDMIGPGRVIWRYDPIILSNLTNGFYHCRKFEQIADELEGYSDRCVVSIADFYRDVLLRIRKLGASGLEVETEDNRIVQKLDTFMINIAEIALSHGFEITSCAEQLPLEKYHIERGKCIDNEYILREFNVHVSKMKDRSQRPECGCVESRDIGMYNSCKFGCEYCYANNLRFRLSKSELSHNPESPSLLGCFTPIVEQDSQMKLF